MEKLTNKEVAALETFKENIQDVYSGLDDFHRHDLNLIRFLRARDLNVGRAEEMFRKTLEWRAENKVEDILDLKVDEYFVERFPFYLTGYDDSHCYVNIIPFGKYDYRAVVEDKKKDELIRFTIFSAERALELFKFKSKQCGEYVNQAVVVSDFEGFSFRNVGSAETLQLLKETILMTENNYPEILKCAIVVNAPKVFEILFNLMKPLLSKATLSKIQIYGSNSSSWREALRKLIPADQFPSQYGGANTSCVVYKIEMGFDLTVKLVDLPDSEMETESVLPGQKFIVSVSVPAGGMRLCWNFKTDYYDIGFSLAKQDQPEKLIFDVAKCDAHVIKQKGVYECKEAEEYVLTFDNSYSKFRSKSLHYVVKILEL